MTAIARARAAWGDDLPDWVLAMAQEVDRVESLRLTGIKIGYSSAVVGDVINKKYGKQNGKRYGDLSAVEQAVRGALMDQTVQCPVLDSIPTNQCLKNQKLPFANVNPIRVNLSRACRDCPHNRENRP